MPTTYRSVREEAVTEARQRVTAVLTVIEHDLVFGDDDGLDGDTAMYVASMLSTADRFLDIAEAAA